MSQLFLFHGGKKKNDLVCLYLSLISTEKIRFVLRFVVKLRDKINNVFSLTQNKMHFSSRFLDFDFVVLGWEKFIYRES